MVLPEFGMEPKISLSNVPPHPEGLLPYAELHAHLGASVPTAALWSLAHEQGFRLPTKNYWEFERIISTHHKTTGGVRDVDHLTEQMYNTTHLIQSSPEALPVLMQHAVSGAYRHNNIVWQEWRVSPMRRNRGGERDLDHIILAMLYGMDRANIEFPWLKIGIIFELYRGFTPAQNRVILEKAKKYQGRGIIGLDISGPQIPEFNIEEHVPLFQEAKAAGFGITFHTGEEGDIAEMEHVLREIAPHRIGHGIRAYKHPTIMKLLAEKGIYLEICPTSNLNCSVMSGIDELKTAIRTLVDNGVKITINTDGPEMHRTSLMNEFKLLKDNGILTETELETARLNAFEASFLK
jgi:adenosine deaminase